MEGYFSGKGKRFLKLEGEICYSTAEFVLGQRKGRGRDTCIEEDDFTGEEDLIKVHESRQGKGPYKFFDGWYDADVPNGPGILSDLG